MNKHGLMSSGGIMKTLITLIALSLLLIACSSQASEDHDSEIETLVETTPKIIDAFSFEPYASMELPSQSVFYDLESLTVNDMIILAMKDELLARQEYSTILEVYPGLNPFASIIGSELKHINALNPLFEIYDIEKVQDESLNHVVLPTDLSHAFSICVEAEVNNIAMYALFLERDDLPDDVRAVFESLMSASYNHLKAFYRAYVNAQ
jgi:hypothetical protein